MPHIIATLIAVLVLAALARWPLNFLSLLNGHRAARVQRDLAYGTMARQKLDIYTPLDAAPGAAVIVFLHGGGWAIGDKAEYGFVADTLTRAGCVAALPNYRLYPSVFPTFVEDAARAVAFVAAELPGRPIFLMGHSAGAHIAALLHLDGRYLADSNVRLAGTIGLSGPYDFLPIKQPRYARVFPPATLSDSQPIRFADGTQPPMLLVSGDADRTVSAGNARRLAAAIEARGGQVSLRIYPGVGHMLPMLAFARLLPWWKPPVNEDVVGFVRRTLAAESPAT
jgi:acetyl esterase/lipase